jgi:putative intracellular protease/amidase
MTTKQTVCCLVFDDYADWEPALALAMVPSRSEYDVQTVGFSSDAVRSMAGMRVQPDLALERLEASEVRLLLVPGGDSWPAGD